MDRALTWGWEARVVYRGSGCRHNLDYDPGTFVPAVPPPLRRWRRDRTPRLAVKAHASASGGHLLQPLASPPPPAALPRKRAFSAALIWDEIAKDFAAAPPSASRIWRRQMWRSSRRMRSWSSSLTGTCPSAEDEILVIIFNWDLPLGEGLLTMDFTKTLNDQMRRF